MEEAGGVVACVNNFFSCRCGVRARGCENNASKVGLVSKKRAKFRRVVVDAKGQGEFGLLMMRLERGRASRKKDCMGIITSPSREACQALARGLHFGSLHRASANETTFGQNGSMFFICCSIANPANLSSR